VANDCRLSAKEHYHIKRVSLDCGSFVDDEAAVRALAAMLIHPSDENIRALQREVNRIAGPVRGPVERTYREQLSTGATTRVGGADLVVAGDGSRLRSTTEYHLRETVVPLAELLRDNGDLVRAMAGRGDMKGRILGALRSIADDDLLVNVRDLDDGRTSVRRSNSAIRVDLGAAVMIGAGNRMIRERRVDAARPREGNLARFDRLVRQTLRAHEKDQAREAERARQTELAREAERARQAERTRLAERGRWMGRSAGPTDDFGSGRGWTR